MKKTFLLTALLIGQIIFARPSIDSEFTYEFDPSMQKRYREIYESEEKKSFKNHLKDGLKAIVALGGCFAIGASVLYFGFPEAFQDIKKVFKKKEIVIDLDFLIKSINEIEENLFDKYINKDDVSSFNITTEDITSKIIKISFTLQPSKTEKTNIMLPFSHKTLKGEIRIGKPQCCPCIIDFNIPTSYFSEATALALKANNA